MVSGKREDPFTPIVTRGKKLKDYASPTNKTPLRNVVAVDENCKRNKSSVSTPLAANRSFSSSNATLPNDDEEERKTNRAAIANRKKQLKTNILSPAVEASPKAALPTSVGRLRGTQNAPIGMNVQLNGAAPPQPKMTIEQRNKVFEEWMKIAADNVR